MNHLDVDRMLASMSHPQWMEWQAWMAIRGPIGGPRMDHYMAVLQRRLAQLNPGLKELRPEDVMSPWLVRGPDGFLSALYNFVQNWIAADSARQ